MKTNRRRKPRRRWQRGTRRKPEQTNTKRENWNSKVKTTCNRFEAEQRASAVSAPRRSDCTSRRSHCAPLLGATVELVEASGHRKAFPNSAATAPTYTPRRPACADGRRQTRRERLGAGNRVEWRFYSRRSRVRN